MYINILIYILREADEKENREKKSESSLIFTFIV